MSFNRTIPRYPDDREILHPLETPGRLETPVKKFKITEVRAAIKHIHSKKAPGYLITRQILKELPLVGLRAIPLIFKCHANRLLPGPMEGFPNYHYPQTWVTSRRSYIIYTHQPAPNPLETICETLPD